MERDEHEMLIEYSEMTTFDFNSKEFQEVKRDFIECEKAVEKVEWTIKSFFENFLRAEAV